MAFPEVNKLRKNGQTEEAYNLASKDLQADPDNIWNKRGMAWVLIAFLKKYANNRDKQNFLEKLAEFRDLKLPVDDWGNLIFKNLMYWVNSFLSSLTKEKEFDLKTFEKFWAIIRETNYPKPSELHSCILRYFLKLKEKWSKIEDFLDWWDFNHFRKEDYEPLVMEEKTIMPLVEQAYLALSKSILKGERKNPLEYKKTVNQEKLERVLKEMQSIYEEHPEYEYFPYHIGLLLSAKGDNKNALGELLPFAREHTKRFWVWTLLGDLHKEDKETQIACYCRGLMCKEPDKMTIGIRKKLTNLLIEQGFNPEAKYELKKIKEIQEENGWKVSNGIKQQIGKDWYKQAEMPKNNIKFYRQHASRANAILAKDLDSMLGVVTNVKKDKKVLGYIVDKNTQGGFNYSSFMDNPFPGDKIEIWSVPKTNKEGETYQKVIYAEITEKKPKEDILRDLNGTIRVLEDKKIGFIEDAFIPPHMVEKHNLKHEQEVQAKAVLNYNKTKSEWGWMVVNLK
jgi:hypothetical protein